jgi:hypothetical protein
MENTLDQKVLDLDKLYNTLDEGRRISDSYNRPWLRSTATPGALWYINYLSLFKVKVLSVFNFDVKIHKFVMKHGFLCLKINIYNPHSEGDGSLDFLCPDLFFWDMINHRSECYMISSIIWVNVMYMYCRMYHQILHLSTCTLITSTCRYMSHIKM